MHKLIPGILIIIALALPGKLMAWGKTGHRVIGEIASLHLSEKALKEVRNILGNESIAMASTWADFIRSDSSYTFLDTWHYINFKANLEYGEMVKLLDTDSTVNAYTKINFLRGELKRSIHSLETKAIYLKLLIHLVGDIHQPLHVSPEGTAGGNTIRVKWFGNASNLHRVWDEQLVEFQQLSYTEYASAINFVPDDKKKKLQQQPLSAWLFESYTIAQELHDEIKTENPSLGYNYNFKHLETLNNQLQKGGVRLAGILNEIFN